MLKENYTNEFQVVKYMMLKDVPVFDCTNSIILKPNLVPSIINVAGVYGLDIWKRNIISNSTNTAVRELIEKHSISYENALNKHRYLTLSNQYWFKYSNENLLYNEVSPYLCRNKYNAPDLYVSGYLNKYWDENCNLVKPYVDKELRAISTLSKYFKNIVKIIKYDREKIVYKNFTTIDLSLEEATTSGALNSEKDKPKDYWDYYKTLNIDKFDILDLLLMDCLVCNTDRHTSNIGVLRNSSTGEFVKMSPTYDFDHAYSCNSGNLVFLQDYIELFKTLPRVELNYVKHKLNIINCSDRYEYENSRSILNKIGNSFE